MDFNISISSDPCTSASLAPIIIEEIDSNSLDQYDLTEFRETDTIKIVDEQLGAEAMEVDQVSEPEIDQQLTKKFLNGELSFSQLAELQASASEDEDEVEPVKPEPVKAVVKPPKKKSTTPSKPKAKRNRRTRLPPALLGLMGEANLRCARGDMQVAENICFEIIRQVPTAQEPFITLAQIYEVSNPEKSLQYSLIAAHVRPQNAEQWVRLANLSEELGDMKQAIICYDKSLKADPKDIAIHKKLIKLVEDTNDTKMILRCYLRYLEYMPVEDGSEIVRLAKLTATNYHHENKKSSALKALEIAYKRARPFFTAPEINLLLELMIIAKKYQSGLQVLAEYANIIVEGMTELYKGETGIEQKFIVIKCIIPDDLIMDLRIKLITCIVCLRATHLFDELINDLLKKEINEVYGELYLELAETFMEQNYYEYALKLLCPLKESSNFSLAAVWLSYAECMQNCGRIDEAISSYQTVIHLAPKHLKPRYTLSALLLEQNNIPEALKALEQDEDLDMLDPGLLYERCKLLKMVNNEEQLLHVGQVLLYRHCMRLRDEDEVETLTRLQDVVRKIAAIKEMRTSRGDIVEDVDAPVFLNANEPTVQEEWLLLKDLLQITYNRKQYGLCQRIAFSAFGSKRFKEYIRELEFTCLITSLINYKGYLAFNLVRELLQKNYDKPRVWNLYNQVVQRADDVRHSKFLSRFLSRAGRKYKPIMNTLIGNNCLVAGTYKYALTEYMNRYKRKRSPFNAFMVGVTLFQMACQKFSAKRPSLISQASAYFFKYAELRGKEARHEIHYNCGRAFHQLGFVHVAIHHYEKVLEITNSLIESRPDLLDLRKEAAYNLCLIYSKSETTYFAKLYLEKYIVL